MAKWFSSPYDNITKKDKQVRSSFLIEPDDLIELIKNEHIKIYFKIDNLVGEIIPINNEMDIKLIFCISNELKERLRSSIDEYIRIYKNKLPKVVFNSYNNYINDTLSGSYYKQSMNKYTKLNIIDVEYCSDYITTKPKNILDQNYFLSLILPFKNIPTAATANYNKIPNDGFWWLIKDWVGNGLINTPSNGFVCNLYINNNNELFIIVEQTKEGNGFTLIDGIGFGIKIKNTIVHTCSSELSPIVYLKNTNKNLDDFGLIYVGEYNELRLHNLLNISTLTNFEKFKIKFAMHIRKLFNLK